jgi:high-affinity Fe2+/Pb2+ permease
MTSEEPTRAKYPGVIVATVTGALLLQVAVQIVAGIREGFETTNVVLIVISLLAAALNSILFFLLRSRRRKVTMSRADDQE